MLGCCLADMAMLPGSLQVGAGGCQLACGTWFACCYFTGFGKVAACCFALA